MSEDISKGLYSTDDQIDTRDAIDADEAAKLKEQGFESGEPIYTFSPDFTVEDIKASLFDSRYTNPKPLVVGLAEDVHLQVVASLVKPVYGALVTLPGSKPLGCYEAPDWYVEGWLLKSGFDPYPEIVRVRMYLTVPSDGGDLGDVAHIQRIPDSPASDGEMYVIRSV